MPYIFRFFRKSLLIFPALLLLFFLLKPSPAYAAVITLDNKSQATSAGVHVPNLSWTLNVGANNNDILFVSVALQEPNVTPDYTVSGVTDNGSSLTPYTQMVGSYSVIYVYFLKNPPTGTNTINATISGGDANISAGAYTFYNVDLNSPFYGTPQTTKGFGLTNSITVPSNNANQLVIDSWSTASDDVYTMGSGQSQLWKENVTGVTHPSGFGSSKPGGGSTTFTWTESGGSNNYAGVGFVIVPAPDCTNGSVNCGSCAAPLNTCSANNGSQTCQHNQLSGGSTICTPTNFSQACTLNNCSGSNVCVGGVCLAPTNTPTPTPAACSTTYVQDNFTRVNQTYWGTASDGHTWGSDASTNSHFSINSNTGQMVGDGTGNSYSGLIGPTLSDAEVLTTTNIASTYQDSNFGSVLRWNDSNNFYKALIGSADNPSFGSCYHTTGTYFIMLKDVAGTYTIFGCPAFTANPGTNYSIRFQANGQTLNAKAWQTSSAEPGSWMITATDNSFASGPVGIRTVDNNGAVTHYTAFILTSPACPTPTPTNTPTPTPTPFPNCTTGAAGCSVCTAPPNTCSANNGTQTCTHNATAPCNPVVFSRACTLSNCSGSNVCVGGVCLAPTNTPTPTPTNTPTPTPTSTPTPTPTPYPDCTSGASGCSACAAPPNTCSANNGTQTCTHNATAPCNPVVFSRACTLSNCSGSNVCVGGVCLAPTNTPTPTPTNTPTPTFTPTPTPVPTYQIKGAVFNDANKDRLLDNGETNYPVNPAISIKNKATGNPAGTVIALADGSFTISNLSPATYIVSYNSVPAGFSLVYPQTVPPPSYQVTVGLIGCSVDNTTGAFCGVGANTGSVFGLYFAITNSIPWFQSYGADLRVDGGITDPIPATSCGTTYASVTGGSSINPGVVFTGDTSADYGSGPGQASAPDWQVGGLNYPETVLSGQPLKTSYQSLINTAAKAGLTQIPLSSVPGCPNPASNCNLPPGLSSGFYYTPTGAGNDVNFSNPSWTAPAGSNFVFAVGGKITFGGKVQVPVGSTALFTADSDIIIPASLTAPVNACSAPAQGQLQGVISADRSIYIQGNNGNCLNPPDTQLNIDGSLITNAAGQGGSLINQRDLCGGNATYPAFTIKARPDFFLYAPQFLMQPSAATREDAP